MLFVPKRCSTRKTILYLMSFAILANLPDLRVQGWGHGNYQMSHSAFVSLGLISVIAALLSFSRSVMTKIGGWRPIVGGTLAWLTHFLLDSFYNHGKGLAMFWPFSEARLALPIPWLSTVGVFPPPLNMRTVGIWSMEFISFFPLLLVAAWFRWKNEKRDT